MAVIPFKINLHVNFTGLMELKLFAIICKFVISLLRQYINTSKQCKLTLLISCYSFDIFVPRLFEEKRRDIVFGFPSFRPSFRPSFHLSDLPSFHPPKVLCTLCAQLLLQFYADSFETLQRFLSWSENMHVVWILS